MANEGKHIIELANDENPQDAVELVEVTLDNKTIKVPKDSAGTITESWKTMESGLKTKHEQAMTEAKNYRQKVDEWRQKDVDWYSSHPQQSWSHYVPLVQSEGEGGYKGDPTLLADKQDDDDLYADKKQDIKSMQPDKTYVEIEQLRKEVANMKQNSEREKAATVVDTMDSLLTDPRYSLAKRSEVFAEIKDHYNDTGKHATKEMVKQFMKDSHDSTLTLINKTGDYKPKTIDRGIPSMGSKPKSPPTKIPSLRDHDAFNKAVHDYMEK